MADEEPVVTVGPQDFDSLSRKITGFVDGLSEAEQGAFGWVMGRAAAAPPWPIQPKLRYRPRGAKHLVFGGSDGLTVLFGRSGFHVIHPEGPLPTELSGYLGAALVVGHEELG